MSAYYLTIPIYSSISLSLDDLPSGLTKEEVLARLTDDDIAQVDVYPGKRREVVSEIRHTISENYQEIEMEVDAD